MKKYFFAICMLILLAMPIASCSSSDIADVNVESSTYTWNVHFQGDSLMLDDVSIIDADNIWAFSNLTENDDYYGAEIFFFNGEKWINCYTFEEEKLEAICAIDSTHIWFIGEGYDHMVQQVYESILFFDGERMETQMRLNESLLLDLFALDSEHVWAVGDSIYFFDGSEWVKQYEPSGGINRITALDSQHAWAQNYEGIIYFYDGREWKYQEEFSQDLIGDEEALTGPMCALDVEHVWTSSIGEFPNKIRKFFFYDGQNWKLQGSQEASFRNIEAADSCHVWAAGSDVVFFNGERWVLQNEFDEVIGDIYVQDETTVWATGLSGKIYIATIDSSI